MNSGNKIDPNLTAGNIRNGISVFGVNGNLKGIADGFAGKDASVILDWSVFIDTHGHEKQYYTSWEDTTYVYYFFVHRQYTGSNWENRFRCYYYEKSNGTEHIVSSSSVSGSGSSGTGLKLTVSNITLDGGIIRFQTSAGAGNCAVSTRRGEIQFNISGKSWSGMTRCQPVITGTVITGGTYKNLLGVSTLVREREEDNNGTSYSYIREFIFN